MIIQTVWLKCNFKIIKNGDDRNKAKGERERERERIWHIRFLVWTLGHHLKICLTANSNRHWGFALPCTDVDSLWSLAWGGEKKWCGDGNTEKIVALQHLTLTATTVRPLCVHWVIQWSCHVPIYCRFKVTMRTSPFLLILAAPLDKSGIDTSTYYCKDLW